MTETTSPRPKIAARSAVNAAKALATTVVLALAGIGLCILVGLALGWIWVGACMVKGC